MSLSKGNKVSSMSWVKHPGHYLFFKIFIWFWLTIIGTVTALIFLSNITVINAVSNEPLHGPMEKNLIYTAKSIERSVVKHKRSLSNTLSHTRLSKRKLLYLSAEQPEDSLTNKDVPIDVDLSLLNFTKSMSPQIIFTEKYQAFGPIQIKVPEGNFYLYEIDINNQPPLFIRLKLMPSWMKVSIAMIASLILSFLFSRNLIAPINSLKKAAVRLSAGDLGARAAISVNRKDELGVLGRDFNSMANQLELLISSQKRLLADISHELRSPLTRLKMATGLAQMQANDASQSYLLRIEKEANQLDKMIADVLQVSRLEAKSQALSLQKQSLQIIVDHVINDAQFEAKQNNKQLNIVGAVDVNINCDEGLIASALENLLRNAIKYAHNTISITLKHADAVYIEICDDGPGVPNGQLSKLCEPFFRQSDARDRVSGGTGLGLAIAKNAIAAHDGSLVLSNKEQGGLCANITLPLIKE
ncbi:two-component system, OmpR family, sensor histidine kinase CpxA [Pseudoalteromonas sp. BSi20652]|uniref:ATP-binding protein n=1 Tax=Pseudoalteromonas sp. BSi20652 TaxID=388384 RepID=UPI000231BB15|nr:ATP-binding protein [Pseudoalteromonas sp. BSi20652]GAA62180.1 two-component system, OmpR family, sensor histidine kinase CpxA [Pseudoalteromonas sp. BSi20652]